MQVDESEAVNFYPKTTRRATFNSNEQIKQEYWHATIYDSNINKRDAKK